MRLTRKCEYALLAMIELARHHGGGPLNLEAISERQEIPRRFLEQIFMALRRAGYITSRKGPEGGYQLAKEPAAISLAEIIRLMDGALAPVESVSKYFYEPTPLERHPRLIAVMRSIRDQIAELLERTSLADLLP
jgi:Rrf2 family protein